MAHMIPATVPQYTQSNAERQLFPVLRDFLKTKFGHAPMYILAYAVYFPDVFSEVKNLPSGGDAHICITGQDLFLTMARNFTELKWSYR